MRLKNYHLQFITQKQAHEKLELQVRNICAKGVKWIQYRRKEEVKEQDKKEEILAIKAICKEYDCILIVNDDIGLAKMTDADGVHLGKMDASPIEARKILGDKKIIGGTGNTLEDILNLCHKGVDYIGLGPFRQTKTKKQLSPILGLAGISNIFEELKKHNITTPIVAVGGIQRSDIKPLAHTGIGGLAISASLIQSIAIEEYVKQVYDNFNKDSKW